MKNKIQKLVLVTLIMTGALTQIGCGLNYPDSSDQGYKSTSFNDNANLPENQNNNPYVDNYILPFFSPEKLGTDKKDGIVTTGLCLKERSAFLQLSDADLYNFALNHKVNNCVLQDARGCVDCYCDAYVKVTTATWTSQGWALNPDSRDSTGCVSEIQWGGYTPAMATPDLALNAVEQIRDALRNDQDVCGLCNPDRQITAEMILGN